MNFVLGLSSLFLMAALCGCSTTTVQKDTMPVTFHTLSVGSATNSEQRVIQPTQRELRDAVVRLGTSYVNALTEQFFKLVRNADSTAFRADAQGQMGAIYTSILQIITGPIPEDNLLDMLVLSTLLRMAFEDYWVPKVYGVKGIPLLQRMKEQENALWSLSEKFLSADQRQQLLRLISEWKQANPDQVDVEGVRLVDFAADDTRQLLYPSGLLPEITEITRSIDEARVLAERVSVLLQFLPSVSLLHTRAAIYELLVEPESRQLLSDITDFSASAGSIAKTINALPERLAAVQSSLIGEFTDRLRQEREAAVLQIRAEFSKERQETIKQLLTQIESGSSELRGILDETRETLAAGKELTLSTTEALMTFDAISVKLGWDKVDSSGEPFNIVAYRDTVYGLRDAAREVDTMLLSMNRLIYALDSAKAAQNLDILIKQVDRRIRYWLIMAFGLGIISILIVRGLTAAVVLMYRRRKARRYLVKDFGASKSPKSTHQRDNY